MRQWCFKQVLLLSIIATGFCQTSVAGINDMTRLYQTMPARAEFEVCSGGGCAYIHKVTMNYSEWQRIASLLTPLESNSEQERQHIALAIAQFERIVGEKTNTSGDLAGTFNRAAGQLDCNDEAINTTTYLRLLIQDGLVVHHISSDIRLRQLFLKGWPHSTASMREINSAIDYAVDSWFYDNGLPAVILPLDVWKAGYTPADSPLAK